MDFGHNDFNWKVGRKLGFEIFVKSRFTWFWSTHHKVPSNSQAQKSSLSLVSVLPTTRHVQRRLYRTSPLWNCRTKMKTARRCVKTLHWLVWIVIILLLLCLNLLDVFSNGQRKMLQTKSDKDVDATRELVAPSRTFASTVEKPVQDHQTARAVGYNTVKVPSSKANYRVTTTPSSNAITSNHSLESKLQSEAKAKTAQDNVTLQQDKPQNARGKPLQPVQQFAAGVFTVERDENGSVKPAVGLWQQARRPAYKSQTQYGDHYRLLVLFTTFKADPSRFRIHLNVIYNWASFRPAVVPVLYNDSSSPVLLSHARQAGWVIRQVTAFNKHGVPLLTPMYHDLKDQFPSSFVGFANGDVLFDEGLVTTLEGVAKHNSVANTTQTLVVGNRHNLFLTTRQLFWPHDVWLAARKEAVEAPVYAEDFFFFYKNKFPWHTMPAIVIGRPAYDNFLVATAIQANVSVVDTSRTLSCIHQYGPGGLGAGRKNTDAMYNRDVIGTFAFHEGYLDQVPYETVYDPKGHITVWKRNLEREEVLNNVRREQMSSRWKEHPESYFEFVDSIVKTGADSGKTK